MNFFKGFLRGGTPTTPEYEIYLKLLRQSRQKYFYGDGRFPDSYEGRLDVLTLHLAALMDASRNLEAQDSNHSGKSSEFSQSLFDVMVHDFDTALREEGYTDSGVKRRIKPMIARFYDRLGLFTESLGDEAALSSAMFEGDISTGQLDFAETTAKYAMDFHQNLKNSQIQQIYSGGFDFPIWPN